MTRVSADLRHDIVYELHTSSRHTEDPATRKAIADFLEAHGIGRYAFPEGNTLRVLRDTAGRLWLHTWRAVGNDLRTAPVCPTCPETCVSQEQVTVPLVAPPPDLPDAYVDKGFGWLSESPT